MMGANTSVKTKGILAVLTIFLWTFPAKGQNAIRTISFSISGGLSSPMSAYSNYTFPSLGLVQNGGLLGLGISAQLKSKVSFGLNGNRMFHPVDAEALAEQVWQENKTATEVRVTASAYQLNNMILYLGYPLKVHDKLRFKFHFGGGLLVAQTSSITQNIAASPPVEQVIKPATGSAFCYQAELGLNYSISDKISVSLFGNYLQSRPTFEFNRGERLISLQRNIQILNAGFRLSYELTKAGADTQ